MDREGLATLAPHPSHSMKSTMTSHHEKRIGHVSTWGILALSVMLIAAATMHRIRLNTDDYSRSPLVAVEMFLMMVIALFVLVQALILLWSWWQRRWHVVRACGINSIIGIGALISAMLIDAPTLMYMT